MFLGASEMESLVTAFKKKLMKRNKTCINFNLDWMHITKRSQSVDAMLISSQECVWDSMILEICQKNIIKPQKFQWPFVPDII